MGEKLLEMLAGLSDSPIKQAALAAFCTLFLEDPTVITCGLLIADGKMLFWAALVGLAVGIHVGDLWLYFLGRMLGTRILDWGWISQERYTKWSTFLNLNLLLTVILSRFLPGTRIPAFAGAGMLKAPFFRFLFIAVFASFLWTLFLLTMTIKIGEKILPLLGEHKYTVLIALLLVLLVVPKLIRLFRRSRGESREAQEERRLEFQERTFGFWDGTLLHAPSLWFYLRLAFKYRGLTLPFIANRPSQGGRRVPLLIALRRHRPNQTVDARWVRNAEELRELSFPLLASPSEGPGAWRGRRMPGAASLGRYLARLRPGQDIIVQSPCNWTGSAELLWYRMPGEPRGRIFSLVLKSYLRVIGDGKSTLGELINDDPATELVRGALLRRHRRRLGRVLEAGRVYELVARGGIADGIVFRDATDRVTPQLAAAVEELASGVEDLRFGRFELRYHNEQCFLAGEDLLVVGLSDPGAEDTRVRDSRIPLPLCHRIQFRYYSALFRLGAAVRAEGAQPLEWGEWLRTLWRRRPAIRRLF